MTLELQRDLAATPYRWLRRLSQGGMGEVHVVEHKGLGTKLVLKLLRTDVEGLDVLAERLRAEGRILTRVVHPNIVRVVDAGATQSGRPFMVTELLDGAPLSMRLNAGPPLTLPEAVSIAVQTLAGLARVHAEGIVHRDIKPDNLFLEVDTGKVKILDFGVAKLLTAGAKSIAQVAPTATGVYVGTPSYMAPEQIAAAVVDGRADLYAVGCVLYRMLTGRPPFVADNPLDVLAHHCLTNPTFEPDDMAKIPGVLQQITLRALAKAPAERFANAEEMSEALRASASAGRPVLSTERMVAGAPVLSPWPGQPMPVSPLAGSVDALEALPRDASVEVGRRRTRERTGPVVERAPAHLTATAPSGEASPDAGPSRHPIANQLSASMTLASASPIVGLRSADLHRAQGPSLAPTIAEGEAPRVALATPQSGRMPALGPSSPASPAGHWVGGRREATALRAQNTALRRAIVALFCLLFTVLGIVLAVHWVRR